MHLNHTLRIGGCQRGLRIALTNDFGASEAMADDMRNKLMKILKCMLVIVLTGTFEHFPVTEFQYWTCTYWFICSTYSEGSATTRRHVSDSHNYRELIRTKATYFSLSLENCISFTVGHIGFFDLNVHC